MKIISYLLMLTVLVGSQGSFANKRLFDAARSGKWDKFWGIRLNDPSADLDYSEDGVSVRDLVVAVGYFDLLDPVEVRRYNRPRLLPLTPVPGIAVRTVHTVAPGDQRVQPFSHKGTACLTENFSNGKSFE